MGPGLRAHRAWNVGLEMQLRCVADGGDRLAGADSVAEGKVKDPWGKKYFHNVPIKMNQDFHVAQMAPVLHYTMVR